MDIIKVGTQPFWRPTGWEAPMVWSTTRAPTQWGATKASAVQQRASNTKTKRMKKNFTLFKHKNVRETQHRCTAVTQTIFSVLSLTWFQELSYSWDTFIGEQHLKGLLLAGTLCISLHRTFSAALSVTNSWFCIKLHHLSCSVGTSAVLSQVRISHFSEFNLALFASGYHVIHAYIDRKDKYYM